MRFKPLIYLSIVIFVILSLNIAYAQDPGIPDTVSIECKEKVLPDSEFTLEAYMFTDSALGGFNVSLTFYNSNNLDIYVDSIVWSDRIANSGFAVDGKLWHNSSAGDTAKTLRFGAVWIGNELPAGQGLVATVYFHTGTDWDSTLYTKVDSTIYYPPDVGAGLELYDPNGVLYIPVFVPGCLGPPPAPFKPQLQLPGTQEVSAGDTVEFMVIAVDSNPSDILTITQYGVGDFTAPPGPSPDTGFFSWITTDADTINSPYVDTFIVDDGTGLADTGFVEIIVNPFYHNPTLNFVPSPPYSVRGGDTLEFMVIATDPDPDDILTIEQFGVGDFTTTPSQTPCSGFFYWASTLADTINSPYSDNFIVNDGTGWADTQFVTIEVFPYVPPPADGDLNQDGVIDLSDVMYLANYIFKEGPAPSPPAAGDVNGDCFMNVGDIIYLANSYFGLGPPPRPWCLPGDVNHDGYVNIPDVIYFINYLLTNGDEPISKNSTDVNADCKIEVVDLVYLINFLFRGGPIPQPGCVNPWAPLAKMKVQTAELKIGSFISDRSSGIIEVPISANFDVPVAGVQLEIGFDRDHMEALKPALSSRTKDLILYHITKQDYQLIGIFDIYVKNLIHPGDGTIITLRFKPKLSSFDLPRIKIREAIMVDRKANELHITKNREIESRVK